MNEATIRDSPNARHRADAMYACKGDIQANLKKTPVCCRSAIRASRNPFTPTATNNAPPRAVPSHTFLCRGIVSDRVNGTAINFLLVEFVSCLWTKVLGIILTCENIRARANDLRTVAGDLSPGSNKGIDGLLHIRNSPRVANRYLVSGRGCTRAIP